MLINNKGNTVNAFKRLKAIYRLLICLIIAMLFYFVFPSKHMPGFTHILSAWDIFSLCMIIISWATFLTTNPGEMSYLARLQDESRTIIFIIVVVSTFASLLAVVLLLTSNDAGKTNNEVRLIASFAGMALSWFLVHTIFTFKYAHLYYNASITKQNEYAGGFDFPGEEEPDYIDFAYFSFVLGMTFQVSDVSVTSRQIRRLVLMHGILSFGFNTIIVALTINVIAGLGK